MTMLEKKIMGALKYSKITLKSIKITQNGYIIAYFGANNDK